MLEYLEEFCTQPKANYFINYFTVSKNHSIQTQVLQAFSNPGDSLGYAAYADKWISSEIITEVFLDFCARTRQKESEMYLKTLSGTFSHALVALTHLNSKLAICGSLDNTFKAASKATLTNKDRQKSKEPKGCILSVLNEDNLIMSWVSLLNSNNSRAFFTNFPWVIITIIVALLPEPHTNAEITKLL